MANAFRAVDATPSGIARRRLPWLLAAFAFGAAVVLARVIQLEIASGAAFRAAAAQPIVRERAIPAERGRILSREGTILACDRQAIGLNVNYRWLQNPPLPTWLRSQARARLPRADRNQPNRIQQAEQQVREDREESPSRGANPQRISARPRISHRRRVCGVGRPDRNDPKQLALAGKLASLLSGGLLDEQSFGLGGKCAIFFTCQLFSKCLNNVRGE